jgi:hypothetical protein
MLPASGPLSTIATGLRVSLVHAELLRQGWTINHKHVLRLLRAAAKLPARDHRDSRHGLPIHAQRGRRDGVD